jgi:alkyl hydroperoxide reductase subunit AhpF
VSGVLASQVNWADVVSPEVEAEILEGVLVRLNLLPETEALKGAKQCLKATIGWLDRHERERSTSGDLAP